MSHLMQCRTSCNAATPAILQNEVDIKNINKLKNEDLNIKKDIKYENDFKHEETLILKIVPGQGSHNLSYAWFRKDFTFPPLQICIYPRMIISQ